MSRRARLPAVSCPDCGRPVIVTVHDRAIECATCGATGPFDEALEQLRRARALLDERSAEDRQLGERQRREMARAPGAVRFVLMLWASAFPLLVAVQAHLADREGAAFGFSQSLLWLGPAATWLVAGVTLSRRLVGWPRWLRRASRAAPPRPGASLESCRVCGATLGPARGDRLEVVRCETCGADNLASPRPRGVVSYEGHLALGALDRHVAEQASALAGAPGAPAWLVVAAALLAPWAVLVAVWLV